MKHTCQRAAGFLLVFQVVVFGIASECTAVEALARHPSMSERFTSGEGNEAPSFQRHVLPLMSRVGCSGRACHGSFKGQGGFRLSLFGYDFALDHQALTGGEESRVDTSEPEESLILLKPTMQKRHKGKKLFEKGSWQYNLLRRWIAAGARNDSGTVGHLERLEISPAEIVSARAGENISLQVLAHWSNGAVEDVTELTRFRTNDESIATVSETGVVTIAGAGDSHVVAFYDNGVTPVPVMLPVSDTIGSRYPRVKAPTKVDQLIQKKLKKVGIVPSELCTDAEFLRRVSLDLTGTLPTPEEIVSFINDIRLDKRARKINELLESPGYAAWWATRLCDLTGNNSRSMTERLYREGFSRQWYDWIHDRLARNEPYDKIVAGIVLATSRENPKQSYIAYATEMSRYFSKQKPADFSERRTMPHYWTRRNMRKPEEKALSFSHAFLGVRLQCAQCHKHPFDQWSKQDFDHFKAFFEPIVFGNSPDGKKDYTRMTRTIESAVGYDRKAKNAAKKRKELDKEYRRRVDAGKPIPWKELFVRKAKTVSPRKNPRKGKVKKSTPAGRVVTPKVLGGAEVLVSRYADPREPLMEWLRDRNNPYFAPAFVNRVWANHFGRGIVDPPDDMNLANPPSNQELLDTLARDFIDGGFDIKALHRTILNSYAYQRSWKPNATNRLDERNFSRRLLRRLPAEVLVDGIMQATASTGRLASMCTDIEKRAIGPAMNSGYRGRGQGPAYALNIFGKPARETSCDCERSETPTLQQTIFTRNDRDMWLFIDAKNGWINELKQLESQTRRSVARKNTRNKNSKRREREKPAAREKVAPPPELDIGDLITTLFLRTVSRPPTADEMSRARDDIKAASSISAGLRDLLWVMLNTKEFSVNH